MYAAGGGFGGALLAILIAKILAGPCCCPQSPDAVQQRPAALSSAVRADEPADPQAHMPKAS
jgi:hypothetical protein